MGDDNLTGEQRMESLITKADGLSDKLEEITDWDGTWTPPSEPPKGNKAEKEFTETEWTALRRACKSKALTHYQNNGFCPSYMKYNHIYQELGGSELKFHHNDPKFLKMVRDGKIPDDMIPDDIDPMYLPES